MRDRYGVGLKTAVFGIGKNFYKYKSDIFNRHKVVTLVDSDESLHGKVISGLTVISPKDLHLCEFDIVLLTVSRPVVDEMAAGLIRNGVPGGRIKHFLFPMELIMAFDNDLFKHYEAEDATCETGYYTDFQGIKYSVDDLPFMRAYSGAFFHSMHDAEEYIGLLLAVESCNIDKFVMFEFGAGWAPWMSAAAFAVKKHSHRTGTPVSIYINGIEAMSNKIPIIERQLAKNGLRPKNEASAKTVIDNIHARIICGVVGVAQGEVTIPSVGIDQYGASLVHKTADISTMVRSYTADELFADYSTVDFVHSDIQGYEAELFSDSQTLEVFRQKVKYLTIGTHSREIELKCLHSLFSAGFLCIREKPCEMDVSRVCLLGGMPDNMIELTLKDGVQVWKNMHLA